MLLTPAFVFIPATLLHCGIRNGRRAAWLTLALASLLVLPYVAQFPATSTDGRLTIILFAGLILSIGIPALLALPMVERAEPFGRALLASLAASSGGFAATELGVRALFGFSPYEVQLEQARAMAAQILTRYQASAPPHEVMLTMKRWMEYGSFVLPAWFLIEAAVVFVLSLVMLGRLRGWRRHAESAADARRAAGAYLFRNLSIPEWLLFAFVIGGLTPILSGTPQKIAANVLAVVTFLYLLQGMAIIRSMLAAAGAGFLSVLFTFLVLGFLTVTGIALLPLSITGLFDSFFDFRHFKRKDDSHESHTD